MTREESMIKMFNENIKMGDTIKLADDEEQIFEAVIIAPAQMLGGHTPVVYLKGKGAYDLNRVRSKYY